MKERLTIFLLFFTSLTWSQSAKFYAKADANRILQNSYVKVEFVLENTDGSGFKSPQFNDFEVIGGPNTSSSMTIINGKVSKKKAYSYSLRPKKVGKLIIGEASIRSEAGFLKSKPISIEVLKSAPQSSGAVSEAFIKPNIIDTLAYVGQQIIVEYKLYTQLNVKSVNFSRDFEIDGFYLRNLSTTGEPTKREIIGGQEYATKVVKRLAIFPQQTGTYEVDPITVNLGVADPNSRSRGFFFTNQLKSKLVTAGGMRFRIDNPLLGSKKSYSGAVGNYTMNAKSSKRALTTDEAIVINIEVQGNGDNKTVAAPEFELSDSLEVYDPNLIQDETFQNRTQWLHKKSFEYLIVPKFPGRYNITPEFTYFDPIKKDYITIKKRLPPFNVLQGSQNNFVPDENEALAVSPIFMNTSLKKKSSRSSNLLFNWLTLVLISIGVAGTFVFTKRIKDSGKFDPDQIRKKQALQKALLRLETANEQMKNGETSKFYEELTIAVKKFVNDKYGIPALHINNSEILNKLENIVSNDQLAHFESILKKSEIGLYAPSLNSETQQLYDFTVKLFSEIEST